MIIDFHTHIFPESIAARALQKLSAAENNLKPQTDATAGGLITSTREAGVDLSIVLPVVTRPSQTQVINDNAAYCNETQSVLFSFGGIHPDNENYREILKDIKNKGLKGVKLHPVFQQTDFDDIRYKRIVSYACELGLILLVHAGSDVSMPEAEYAMPGHILPLLRECRPDKMILAHMGGWNAWDPAEELLEEYPDVYVDTAFTLPQKHIVPGYYTPLPPEQFHRMINIVGIDRVLFGTDSPWTAQKDAVADVNGMGLSEEAIQKVLSGNAARLLELEKPASVKETRP